MRWFPSISLSLLIVVPLTADEKEELSTKQKKTAVANLKKANVEAPNFVETDQLLLCGPLPEEKLKAWGEMVQKQYALALKALKFENSDNPPKGRVTVYFFPERKHYTLLVGELVNERVDKDERGHADASGDTPYVAVTVVPGGKPTDLDVEAGIQITGLLLQSKARASQLTTWMKEGFAKAIQMRSAGVSANGDRAKLKAWLTGTKDKPAKYKVSDVWSASEAADRKLLAGSLMEYFIFGSGAATYSKIVSGLVPDGQRKPTIEIALTAAELKVEDLDAAWKKWVLKGK
jgi:hypothetical protein